AVPEALAPASTAPETGGSKVVFSCHGNSLTGLSATTSNNLALRGHPIRTAPGAGRIPNRPPLPAVAAGLGFGASATQVYDRARFTGFTRSLGCGRTWSHALN
uniref:hypothetical protein n=1 Tax=Alistipes sp. D31t1_170403_E11 TaxID=2787128 RepID=UPI001E38BD82